MTFFPDLSHCSYFPDLTWNRPFLAVGWLDAPHPYPKGRGITPATRERIAFLREASLPLMPLFRGLHDCGLCEATGSSGILPGSNINLFIPGEGCIYCAPGRIDHHIEVHLYEPPEEFMRHLMTCPPPGTPEYLEALTDSNGGVAPPF